MQAKSGDWIFMLDDLVHGGTGDEGLRLFGSLVHQSQAERSDPKEELYLTSSFTTRRQPMEEFIKNLRAKEIHLAIDAVDMIEYLKANPYVLDAVQGHYDYLARKRLSIFDPDRAVKDIEAIALDAFQGGNYFHHVHNHQQTRGY